MQKINLVHPEKSDVKYVLTTFPDGEPHIKLDPIDRKHSYLVICRITNPNELFVLMQVGNILNRQGVEWELIILYLMSARMDRVMSFDEAFTLEIVANSINSIHPTRVQIFEPHSERSLSLINNAIVWNNVWNIPKDAVICFPDEGAFTRYKSLFDNDEIIKLKKVRDPKTGRILNINFDYTHVYHSNSDIWIVDDLCDAGGTFVLASKLLRNTFDSKIHIAITHLVNPIGLKNLSENFDTVMITNSYKDWDVSKYPNIKVTDFT